MNRIFLPLALSLCCLAASGAEIKLSAIPDSHAPATNDFILGRDISETGFSADGRAKEFGLLSVVRLAETNLTSLTTTGRVYGVELAIGDDPFDSLPTLRGVSYSTTAAGWTNAGASSILWDYTDLHFFGFNFYFYGAADFGGYAIEAGDFIGPGTSLTGVPQFATAGAWTARQTFQAVSGVQHNHGNQATAVTVQVATNAHRVALTGDATVTIGGTAPASPARTVLELELVQDGTGGRTPTISPTPANGQPVIDETANAVTVVYLRTSDGGSTWQAFSSYDSGGGTGDDLGVRSEFIPVGYMRDSGVNSPAAAVNTTSGNGIVETRLFNDPLTESLFINWQRPRDAVDATAGGDFQMKWRWIGITPSVGLSSDTISMALSGVGKATGDPLNSTFGTPASSTLSSATHPAEDWIFGSWSEITFTSTADGAVSFFLQFDATTSTDDLRLVGVEFLFSTDLDAVTYASP